jgi:hypothetical protein
MHNAPFAQLVVDSLQIPLNVFNDFVKVFKFAKVVQLVAKGVSRNINGTIDNLTHNK